MDVSHISISASCSPTNYIPVVWSSIGYDLCSVMSMEIWYLYLHPYLLSLLEFIVNPVSVSVCDAQSLPQVFNVFCAHIAVHPHWIVTEMDGVADQAVCYSESVGSLSYTMGSTFWYSNIYCRPFSLNGGKLLWGHACLRCRLATVSPSLIRLV